MDGLHGLGLGSDLLGGEPAADELVVVAPFPFTAGSRKPPSQRNAEYEKFRQARALKSMAAGTMAGRVTNASRTDLAVSEITASIAGFTDLGRPEIVFQTDSQITLNAPSAPYVVADEQLVVLGIHATLGTVGSTPTVVTLTKNGTTLTTITVPSGQSFVSNASVHTLAQGDVVRATVTQIGSGATKLTVQVRTQ